MTKWLALLVGQGPDPVASLRQVRQDFIAAFSERSDVRRATFSTVEAPSIGSRMNFDATALDAILEVWLAPASDTSPLAAWLEGETAGLLASAQPFTVREHVVIAPTGGDGRIKRITLIKRLGHMTPAAFEAHWTRIHAAMARDLPHVRSYVQNLMTPSGAIYGADVPDAIADMRFDATDRIAAAFGSPTGKRLISDTPRFCGSAASFQTTESVLFDHGVPAGA